MKKETKCLLTLCLFFTSLVADLNPEQIAEAVLVFAAEHTVEPAERIAEEYIPEFAVEYNSDSAEHTVELAERIAETYTPDSAEYTVVFAAALVAEYTVELAVHTAEEYILEFAETYTPDSAEHTAAVAEAVVCTVEPAVHTVELAERIAETYIPDSAEHTAAAAAAVVCTADSAAYTVELAEHTAEEYFLEFAEAVACTADSADHIDLYYIPESAVYILVESVHIRHHRILLELRFSSAGRK